MSTKHGSHWLEREDVGDVTVVRVKTPKVVDDDIVRTVFDPVYALISEAGRTQVVLNLAAVEGLPSLGIGKLVMLNRKTQVLNGRLALCQLTPIVKEILEATHLTDLLNIYTTEQEAVQSFAEAKP
jgi:anti-anti-sigma factor